jgi:hypothetical protein
VSGDATKDHLATALPVLITPESQVVEKTATALIIALPVACDPQLKYALTDAALLESVSAFATSWELSSE